MAKDVWIELDALQCKARNKEGYRCLLWEGHGDRHDFDNHTNPIRRCSRCHKLKNKAEFDNPSTHEDGQQVCRICAKSDDQLTQ